MAKKIFIIGSVIAAAALLAGLGVLIWWLVTRGDDPFSVRLLKGEGIGEFDYTAAFTEIPDVGDVFWWFYPTIAIGNRYNRPIILWLDGVTGVPPSLLANLGMFGPYDINFNRRQDSWINRYNLLFIDAPLGTGFSRPLTNDQIPKTPEENAEHLALTLESFYTVHEGYKGTPLYIFGQAHGAQLALALAANLYQKDIKHINLRGVVLGNAIISPALAMTKLGFYLEELGYIDANGRDAIETLSKETTQLVQGENYEDAFDKFISLGQFVNENAGATAVNLGNIVQKLTREPTTGDLFGLRDYLRRVLKNTDLDIMNTEVAAALGISDASYDSGREAVINAFKSSFMTPATDKVEYILENTPLSVAIYNGNLDAVSNTPGQLEWVENLTWTGMSGFLNAPRQSIVVNRLVEGYQRNGIKLQFFWVNAAGQSTPLDNPAALNSIINRIVY
ncbi:hypothetical protein PYW07_002395 [Mythimna separata]|uniref:Uncharacterized protein n=1 Tax=Mythimna separata TaxID=271217 RepID=A0AAD7YNA4_MYTSE|nr:hypothetical protein PYW07_002395 [Mythimna separata]